MAVACNGLWLRSLKALDQFEKYNPIPCPYCIKATTDFASVQLKSNDPKNGSSHDYLLV